ncbi:restriction endonuclease subunit R, partial [Patescibacteria group bacterium]|nr:restriction endonuclease subunit R [Patescibacteria group bacterium]
EGFFETINRDDSDINVLMGSRSFYEGWDSNRPNIILFVNIGIGSDAKKFVLQSVGRGVRIEPIKNKRKRFKELFNAKEVKGQLFNKVKNLILPIESLFVFGTNAENLKEIINTLKTQKSEGRSLRDAFEINPETKKHLLLVPVYREVDKLIAEETDITPFQISQKDFELTKSYFGYIGPKVALVKYDCEPRVLESANKGLREEQSQRYNFNEDRSIEEPELLAGQILKFLGLKMRKLDRFKELGKEIVHFEEIKFRDGDKYKEIMSKIQQVGNYGQKDAVLEQLQLGLEKHKNIQKYTSEIQKVEHEYVKENTFELNHQKVKIKYLANHYYLPVIVSESQKIDYLNHIINVESERKFLEELEEYVSKSNSIFSRYQWMFSKLDQTLDNVGLVYYNQKEGEITNFTPDFVFWLQKGNEYLILFVDPHGTAHRDADLKIDWFKKIFTKDFYDHNSNSEKIKVKVKLLFKPARGSTIIDVSQKYREYWFDNFADFANKIS